MAELKAWSGAAWDSLGGSGGGAGVTLMDEGSVLPQRDTLNFSGKGVLLFDDGTKINALIAGGGITQVPFDVGMNGTWVSNGVGNDGDFALVRNGADGDESAWLIGPKTSGVWPNFGYQLNKGMANKTRLAGNYTSATAGAVTTPALYAMCLGNALPNTDLNGFSVVQNLAIDGTGCFSQAGIGGTAANTARASLTRGVSGQSGGPMPSNVVTRVQVAALPMGGGFAGCGTSIKVGSGYWALTDSNGKLHIIAGIYNGTLAVGTPMASGVNGDVAAGDWIIFKRQGAVFTAQSINGTTGAIKRDLTAVMSGPGDQGGSQWFSEGASAYFIYNDNGTARLSNGWCMI